MVLASEVAVTTKNIRLVITRTCGVWYWELLVRDASAWRIIGGGSGTLDLRESIMEALTKTSSASSHVVRQVSTVWELVVARII
jgi:hypothetical protein